VNQAFSKRGRKPLALEHYHELRQEILQRDGWRCQSCGRSEELQVHHINARSRLGQDTEENLITLCGACHARVHGNVDSGDSAHWRRNGNTPKRMQ
jgi:5-methylcytosine-specific restriction endonuclease McrA